LAFDFWRKSNPEEHLAELASQQECEALLCGGRAILFKHSPSCAISWAAHREVLRFRATHPDAAIYLISVRRQRELSRYIADHTGIEHESPQILALANGRVAMTASHGDITADLLISAWRQMQAS
jgi:bacillithiol system protein YtxJ